ncbi:hypothetical protein ADIARSV_2738 [Arcticibacter svalbardensis MN12-7]|uniref:Uncharacterized protein n=1 Tax=Arcticibacter svalbardensis MN12-7 TaxID=1150600 RepID=R9GRG7_9SPHI|nr:hypothetical protein [Arcticibacter svalbardensis]EOR94125.1 hypothetical protein ADIARSV_2738 [Arcticibacter svalbardensis MN12-7]
MRQALNFMFKDLEYDFQVIKFPTVSPSYIEVQVLLNHVTRTLVKSTAKWQLKENNGIHDEDLIEAVGQAIDERYRLI